MVGEVNTQLWEMAAAHRKELLELAAVERASSPSSRLGTQSAGWNSRKQSPSYWNSAAILDLVEFASESQEHQENWTIALWFNVLPQGARVALHDHRQADWVAVYYVRAGDPAADLVFPELERRIQVEDGLCLFFPGELEHMVEEYSGTKERVSIAINATKQSP